MKTCKSCGLPMMQRMRGGKRSGWHCRPCANEKSKAYRLTAPDAYLNNKLWTFYRIRLADFRRMLVEQGGACKVCRKIPRPDKNGIAGTGLCIDHDHSCCPSQRQAGSGGGRICGKCIRGLLCQQCNVALAMVGDNPDTLRALIEYLQHHVTSTPALRATLTSAADKASVSRPSSRSLK